MKILILGCNGMLGHKLFTYLQREADFKVVGFCRKLSIKLIPYGENIVDGMDFLDFESLLSAIDKFSPELIINCAGVIKQKDEGISAIDEIKINSLLPHMIANYCDQKSIRLIHFSTDCVFSGRKGNYSENDQSDCYDFYGKTKFLGEIDSSNHLTIRTSIIGHELDSEFSLLSWFLKQKSIKGYKKAVFSGVPTIFLAKFLKKYLIPNNHINGIKHLSASPIDKFSLLKKINKAYSANIEIEPDDSLKIDRSLNSTLLMKQLDAKIPPWDDLIDLMYTDFYNMNFYRERRD
tara:strand:+ start:1135 stop:2010 length:876 start_codon:yes stop_codon:yes gene_type:complete